MKVAIVGARDRSSIKDKFFHDDIRSGAVTPEMKNVVQRRDRVLLEGLIANLKLKYGGNLTLISVGCDDGIGFLVKTIANNYNIQFVEVSLHFLGERRHKAEYSQFYLSRNATINELSDIFYILPSNSKQAVVDDLMDRVRAKERPQPYVIINEDGVVIDKNNIPDEDLQLEPPKVGK